MSKNVDHQQRRLEVLAAARRVIVRDGIEAATTRAIAREAGYSSGILTHYFDDKDDILSSLLRHSHERSRQRRVRRTAGVTGLAALRELLLDSLPLDAERTRETRLEIDFWSRGLSARRLAEVQRREHAKLRAATRRRLAEAHDAGEIILAAPPERPDARQTDAKSDAGGHVGGDVEGHARDDVAGVDDLDAVTKRLLALVDGLSLHLLLYPDRVTRAEAERLVLAELDRLTPPS
ncbi:TetR/AcrR family transcriptional regulator [Thermopolyspora sp. NPDC052614]|uniref:TetR/AcrR family transcriptional regulator n=1 Tax=Thermopolyspora sp. NPDC052614 TaxID=3155682 RepID=UPI003440A937